MNLYDLLKRKDRAVTAANGVQADLTRLNGALHRTLKFEPGAQLILADAHAFSVLSGFPQGLHWQLIPVENRHASLLVDVRPANSGRWLKVGQASAGENGKSTQNRLEKLLPQSWRSAQSADVSLKWPLECGNKAGFDLRVRNSGDSVCLLSVGRALNPRERILPLLKGVGLEVGPGTNPMVRPDKHTSVHYVEAASAEQWQQRYRKSKGAAEDLGDRWDRYIIDSAQHLNTIEDGSLDFVFSNHVFEHLPNPLGVLNTWLRKLKPGGIIAGVIPDARYTFDCRQPLSETSDFRREMENQQYDLVDAHFERWCQYTAPYNTPDELKARGYSVHVHYYSPEVFSRLSNLLNDEIDQAFLESGANNKDFGFVLRKAETHQKTAEKSAP